MVKLVLSNPRIELKTDMENCPFNEVYVSYFLSIFREVTLNSTTFFPKVGRLFYCHKYLENMIILLPQKFKIQFINLSATKIIHISASFLAQKYKVLI